MSIFFGTMSGPCWDHVWPSFTSRPARALKFSTLNPNGLRTISMECLFLGTMSGPFWDHVWPSFTYRPIRALKCSTLSPNCLKDHLYGVSIFGDYVGTMFGLALLPDQLEH